MSARPRIHPFIAIALAVGLVLGIAPAAALGVSEGWTRQFGTSGYDDGVASAVDANRNIYVVGSVRGALPGQKARGGRDAFVRKYRPGGSVVWTRQFGTSGHESVYDVAVDKNGNVIVVGSVSGQLKGQKHKGSDDVFVRKYRASGVHVWTRQFGTVNPDYPRSVAVDTKGDVVVSGYTYGTLWGQKQKGGGDAFVRKYRSNGRHAWTRQFGTVASDDGGGVAVDRQNNVYVVGNTYGTLWGQTSKGGNDAFVRKYRSNGVHVWTRQFGTAGWDSAWGVAVDSSGRIIVVGTVGAAFPGKTSQGHHDAFVRKYKPNGAAVWTRQFGTAGWDSASDVTIDLAGRLYVGGSLDSTASRGFVRKLWRDGSLAWSRTIVVTTTDEIDVRGVSVDKRGKIYAVGTTEGPLPGKTLQGAGDAFIRQYRP